MMKPALQGSINTQTLWHPILRPIARLLVLAQLALVLQPLSVLAQDNGQAPFNPASQSQLQRLGQWSQDIEKAKAQSTKDKASPADQVSDHLKQADDIIKGLGTSNSLNRRIAPDTRQRDQQIHQLKTHLSAISQGSASVRAEFAATRTELKAKNLPADILARHDEAAAQFEQRSAAFAQIASRISHKATTDDSDLSEMGAFFNTYPASRKPATLQPGKLPWGAPKATPRMPAETKTAWYQNLTKDNKVQLAQAGGLTSIGGIQFTHPPEPTQAPQSEDLAETPDIQLTPAIRAKAKELGNNPVAITNWVRNTIQYLPTWGSIQGADGTLKTLRGNAFDTASLTIALLRASSIPARYQFGTIDLPAAQAMNWVGGVQKPEAALDLMYQGGIAARGLITGGRITTIRLEHVWVNAYVNWTPSRGNKQGGAAASPKISTPDGLLQHVNPNGNLNAWVPLDASYKQYSYTQGMDLKTQVPMDANALLAAVQQDATVDLGQGWVQGLNQAGIQSELNAYQGRLQAYADAQKPNASVADVFGQKAIIPFAPSLLAGTTPYVVVLQGNQATAVPDSLRWKITFKLYASASDKTLDNPLLSRSILFPELGTKRLSASGVAATAADQALLNQYNQAGATTLPLYLIRQKVQLKLDDQLLVETGPQRMGDTQWWTYVLSGPNLGSIEEDFKYENAVGDATAFSIDATGILYQEAANRASAVNPDTALENLHQFGLGYWSRVNEADAILAKGGNVVAYRLPSVGLFTSPLNVAYSWGVPRAGQYRGYAVDIRRLSTAVTGISNPSATKEYLKQAGARNSFLEGRIFEEMLGLAPGAAASAVSVIAAANDQGIRLWQLNASNLPQYLAVTTASANMQQQVADAVNNGLDVLAPQDPVQLMRWTGQGYIATDPQTGAGAYIIEGVGNGGELITCEAKVEPLVEAIAQRILTQVAIRLALFLMAEAGLATASVVFPPAAPVLAQVMVMVGITFLTFSAQAANPACTKAAKDCHRGRFQAQGGKGGIYVEKSVVWGLPMPLTKTMAYGLLDSLAAQLTARQLEARAVYFSGMKAHIVSRPAEGVCVPWERSEPLRGATDGVRVDAEVKAGQAFVN